MSPPETSDSELIERIKKRDPDGLAAAYDRYSSLAYGLFLRITRDRTVAEDLLQELFMRVWNRARDFDSNKGALGVWIVSIARNMAIDHLRSAQSRFKTRLRPLEHVDPLLFAQGPSETESVLDRRNIVKTALANLNANERRALELAYFDGYSQTEIARTLNEPLGTVKTWIRTGLGRLRSAVRQEATS
ncbi:MAG: sigma-70 family RNA polymerase sigma factor [Acidobacteriaceae bacterium]|nr:sigma-70 family RNA polymerase sigma factor [Acidobacteriaceae bacterium]